MERRSRHEMPPSPLRQFLRAADEALVKVPNDTLGHSVQAEYDVVVGDLDAVLPVGLGDVVGQGQAIVGHFPTLCQVYAYLPRAGRVVLQELVDPGPCPTIWMDIPSAFRSARSPDCRGFVSENTKPLHFLLPVLTRFL